MISRVLLLGRPGSGKTTAAHYLAQLAQEKGLRTAHIDDYEILQEKCRADLQQRRFRPLYQQNVYSGFDVLDFSVLDEALIEAEARARQHMAAAPGNSLVTLEFARDNYLEALQLFSPDFLQSASILFFVVDTETSIQRVQQRYQKTGQQFVSEHILRNYYRDSDLYASVGDLQAAFNLQSPIAICDNSGSWRAFFQQLNQFFNLLLAQEVGIL